MKLEKLLLLSSFISFIFGFSLLVYLSYSLNPQKLTPSQINENFLGNKVIVTGKVIEIVKKEKVNYIIVSDENKNFTIVVFPNVFQKIKDKLEYSKQKTIEVIGILTSYKGNLQIILQNPDNLKVLE